MAGLYTRALAGGVQIGLTSKGGWNATTNTPTLATGVGSTGTLYRVTVAGGTTLDGESTWVVDDDLYFDGTAWVKIDNNVSGGGGFTPGDITEITSTTYTVLVTDDTVLVNQSSAAAVTLTLPTGASHNTKRVQIKDKKGTAASFNITVNRSGGDTIDGATSLVLDANRVGVELVFNGTEWSIF